MSRGFELLTYPARRTKIVAKRASLVQLERLVDYYHLTKIWTVSFCTIWMFGVVPAVGGFLTLQIGPPGRISFDGNLQLCPHIVDPVDRNRTLPRQHRFTSSPRRSTRSTMCEVNTL
ncbi:hypothetical protein M8J77_023821 [Diaphorina citri]|nr:hypothetical protein M8J77_023821 [Diaphorina citri]